MKKPRRHEGSSASALGGAIAIAALLALPGCGGSQGATKEGLAPKAAAPKVGPGTAPVVDLSGGWSDRDSRDAAEAASRGLLGVPALERLRAEVGRVPVVALFKIRNRCSDPLNLDAVGEHLRRALAASKKVAVVAGGDDPSTEKAADLLLDGTLHLVGDALEKIEIKGYYLVLTLTDRVTREKLWIRVHRVVKQVERLTQGGQLETRVTRLDPLAVRDLAGYFNVADVEKSIRAVGQDFLANRSLVEGPARILRSSSIRNRSSEQIDTALLAVLLEELLLGSGKVRILDTRDDAAPAGEGKAQLAATGLLLGEFLVVTEAAGKMEDRLYTLAVKIVDPDSNRVMALSKAQIQKRVEKRAEQW